MVLTGINLGDFGKGLHGGKKKEENFFELIEAIENKSEIERVRISSIEPNLLSLEMISFISQSKKFMPHFHMPLQSGSDKTLAGMRRRYKKDVYAERVEHIKKLIPHACIGADVIVGFPGETDADFKESSEFITSLDISYLHVFTYSERENTLAVDLKPVVPISVRNERNKMLRNMSFVKMQQFTSQHNGQTRKVLFEGKNKNGMMEGYTDNYIKITTLYQPALENKIVDWEI